MKKKEFIKTFIEMARYWPSHIKKEWEEHIRKMAEPYDDDEYIVQDTIDKAERKFFDTNCRILRGE